MREIALNYLSYDGLGLECAVRKLLSLIDRLSQEPQAVWVVVRRMDGSEALACSNCGLQKSPTLYCPGCGHHMAGKKGA